jgi:hypothetical protein
MRGWSGSTGGEIMTHRAVVCASSVAVAVVLAPGVRAQTAVSWNNNAGGNWSVAGNWNPQTVPSNGTPIGSTYLVTIDLAGTYSVTLDQTFTVTDLIFNNATATLGSTGGNFVSVGTVRHSAGTLSGIAKFTTNNLIFDNVAKIDIDDVCIDHKGLAEWTGTGNIALNNGADIQNRLGATFRITNNQKIIDTGGGVQPFIVNAGTFEKIGGGGLTEVLGVLFTNTGTVQVDDGTFKLTDLTNLTAGVLTGGTWNVNSATLDLAGNAIMTNDATVSLSGATSAMPEIDGMTTIGTSGSFAISSGRDFTTAGGFTNDGTIRTGAGTTFRVASGSTLTNYAPGTRTLLGGVYDLAGDLRFDGADVAVLDASVTLDGLGSSFTDETGASALRSLDTISGGGTLVLLAGRDLKTPGALTHDGIIRLGATGGDQSILEVSSSLTQSAGRVILEGGRVKVTTSYSLVGGSLEGSGDIDGDFASSGTVAPGFSPGQLNFTNNFTQLQGGNVLMEIGGPVPGQDHDFIAIQGVLQFEGLRAGTLEIQLLPTFVPQFGEVFQIMQYGQIQGEFAQILGLDLGGGLFFVPEYTQNSLNLFVVPSSGVLMPMGLAAMFCVRRRERRARLGD